MQQQAATAKVNGAVRVPQLPVGAEASSSAAAAEAIVDARIAGETLRLLLQLQDWAHWCSCGLQLSYLVSDCCPVYYTEEQ